MEEGILSPSGFAPALLWQNASPSTEFNAQTISSPSFAGFDWFILEFIAYSSNLPPLYTQSPQFAIAKKGKGTLFGGINALSYREYQITDTGIQFQDAGYVTPYGGAEVVTTNAIMIPSAVYGIG